MSAPQDGKLDLIRKLLAKAESPAATPAEAETYTAKATELIAKYGVDEALLADRSGAPMVPGDVELAVDAPYARDKAHLLVCIAYPLGCRTIKNTRTVRGETLITMHLFGFKSDLDRVEMLYTSLLVQAAHALAVAEIPYDVYLPSAIAAWRRSWYAGFSAAINHRLKAAQETAKQAAANTAPPGERSVALVLADRSALITKAVADAYPNATKARPRTLSGEGHRDGVIAGRRANIGTAKHVDANGRRAVSRRDS